MRLWIAALLGATVAVPPAHAADVPAYGVITIADAGDGRGIQATASYDPVLWSCTKITDERFGVATFYRVACRPNPSAGTSYACTEMVLTTRVGGSAFVNEAASAGGRVSCNGSMDPWQLDTGQLYREGTQVRSGDLGPVVEILCEAYADRYLLVPPYAVTCVEPGLPRP